MHHNYKSNANFAANIRKHIVQHQRGRKARVKAKGPSHVAGFHWRFVHASDCGDVGGGGGGGGDGDGSGTDDDDEDDGEASVSMEGGGEGEEEAEFEEVCRWSAWIRHLSCASMRTSPPHVYPPTIMRMLSSRIRV